MEMVKPTTFIDLFAGTGAFSYVLEQNGLRCVFANDITKSSKSIYDLNIGSTAGRKLLLKDLNTINVSDIPKHNILCAGIPCQPFSIAGHQKGWEDTRSNVFWKLLEILKTHKPEIIILENVKNLTSHDKGNTYKVIETNLSSLGYKIKAKVLDTCKITNIPHHRERIYIVGFIDSDRYDQFNFEFPLLEQKKICEFLEPDIPDEYYYTKKLKVFDTIQAGVTKHISTNTLYQYRRYYVRENKSNCCPTLTANMGVGGHNVPLLKDDKGIRKLTPRECFNFQGFPKAYKLPSLCNSALYKLAGNAVSVPVVELIVQQCLCLHLRLFESPLGGSLSPPPPEPSATPNPVGVASLRGVGRPNGSPSDYRHPKNVKSKKLIKYVDLFCGLGAFHIAFNRKTDNGRVDYRCVFACDIDPDVSKIYEENFDLKPFGDINTIDINSIPDFDILCAGFPCTPFSIAGKQEGFEDKDKGNLFYKILEIIDIKQPQTLILENVKNLRTIHNGKTFKIIKTELLTRGYKVSYKVIDSKYYNSPQSRKRIYIICDKKTDYHFPEIKNPIVPVSSIIDTSIDRFFDYEPKYKLEKSSGKNGRCLYKLINKTTGKGGRQGERVYSLKSYGPTICASSGGPGSKTGLYSIADGKIRTLEVGETLQMFGFPANYKFSTLKNKKKMLKFLGNSIVVNVLELLIRDIPSDVGPKGRVEFF